MESVAKRETTIDDGLKSNRSWCADCRNGKYLFTSYSLKWFLVG